MAWRDLAKRGRWYGVVFFLLIACSVLATTSAVAAPTITSVSPTTGPVGTVVTIKGTGFSATPSSNAVTFNGRAATVSSATTTQIVTSVPTGATSGALQVRVGSATATYNSFTVTPALSITSVSPSSGPIGTSVTISGTGFSATKTSDIVTFNGTTATVSTASTTQLVVTVPSGATSGPIKVVVGSSSFTWNSFTVGASLNVTGVSPTNGAVGTTVTITGTGFSTTPANNAVTFNGTAATVSSASSTQLVTKVPSSATSGPIKVVVGSSSFTWNSFTVGAPLNVTGVSPTSGPVGTTVTITGTGFSATPANNTVTFNGTAATVSSASSTQLVTTVPSAATSGPIKIVVGSSSFTWNSFTVGAPLNVTGVSPTSGPVGATVTISGTGFSTTPANNTVTFNGTAATVTSATSTQLVTTVPSGATSGSLKIKVSNSTFTFNSFTVTPAITGFSPTSGAAGTAVTITGTNFDSVATNNHVDFNGVTATVTAANAAQLTATVPVGISTGPIHVKVGGYTATSSGNFSPPAPTISSISPTSGPPGAQITIKGTNFSPNVAGNAVTFGGVAASVISATPTQLLAVVPGAAKTGPVQVTIAGQVATSTAVFTVTTPNVVFTTPQQTQQLTFAGKAGQPMVVEVANVSLTGGTLHVAVTDPNGVQVTNADFNMIVYGRDGLMLFVDPQLDGTYVVQASIINDSSATGSAQILFDSGTLLTVDGSTVDTSTYVPGQSARLNFNGTTGQNLTLMMSDPNGAAVPAYSYVVFNPDGTKYTQVVDCSGGKVFSCDLPNLPQTGTYTLVMMPYYSDSGAVSLTANLTFAVRLKLENEPTASLSATSTTVTLAETGQHARLQFNAVAGQLTTVNMAAIQLATNDDMYVVLRDASGTNLALMSNYTGGVLESFVPSETGSYTAVVYSYNGSTGSAQLRVDPGTSISLGGTASANTTLAGAVSRLNFNATAGQNIALVLSGLNTSPSPSDVTLILFNPDGTLNANRRSYNGLSCNSALTASGGCGWFLQGLPQTGSYSLLVVPGYVGSSTRSFTTSPITYSATVAVTNDPDGSVPLPTLAITGLSPVQGPVGSSVVISGQHFGATPSDNTVSFSGQSGTVQAVVTAASSTQLAVTVPDTAATGPLFVSAGGVGAWSPVDFTVKATLQAQVTLSPASPEPSLVGLNYWIPVTVTPVNQGGVQPTGTVTVSRGSDMCQMVLGQDNGCALPGRERGQVEIFAVYSGDSHYERAYSATITHSIYGFSLYGFAVQIASEPSQAGAGTFVQPVFNAKLWNYPNIPVIGYHAPTGFVSVSDGVNSCIAQSGAIVNPSCYMNTPAAGTRAVAAYYSGDDFWEPATAPVIWHATSSAGGANALPAQTEICGFDPNASYPAQSGFVPIEQLSGAVPSMGLVAGATGSAPLAIAITSPAANSTTGDSLVDVVGAFTGPANTGITVNGIIASTLNGQFVANNVPLGVGANNLNVVATTLAGVTANATVAVTRSATPGPISISIGASTANVFYPASIPFTFSVGALPNGATVQSIYLEYGTGSDPWTGSAITSAPQSVSYSVPGVYQLKLTVTDNKGNKYSALRTVLIQDYVAMRSMLCDVYGYLKDRLRAKDASGAKQVFQPSVQSSYQGLFDALGNGMPAAVPQLGVIASGMIGRSYAEMTLVRDNANQTRNGFPLRMALGTDGVWRISEM